MDELEQAIKDAEKIQVLREELDRLRSFVYGLRGLGGNLLDTESLLDGVLKPRVDRPNKNSGLTGVLILGVVLYAHDMDVVLW